VKLGGMKAVSRNRKILSGGLLKERASFCSFPRARPPFPGLSSSFKSPPNNNQNPPPQTPSPSLETKANLPPQIGNLASSVLRIRFTDKHNDKPLMMRREFATGDEIPLSPTEIAEIAERLKTHSIPSVAHHDYVSLLNAFMENHFEPSEVGYRWTVANLKTPYEMEKERYHWMKKNNMLPSPKIQPKKNVTFQVYCKGLRRGRQKWDAFGNRIDSSEIPDEERFHVPLHHYTDLEAQNVELGYTFVKMNSALYRFFGVSIGSYSEDVLDGNEHSGYPPPPPQHFVAIDWTRGVLVANENDRGFIRFTEKEIPFQWLLSMKRVLWPSFDDKFDPILTLKQAFFPKKLKDKKRQSNLRGARQEGNISSDTSSNTSSETSNFSK